MYCPHCGTEAIPNTVYCAKCGKPLAGEATAQTPPPESAPSKLVPPTARPSPPKRRRLRLVLFIVVPIIVLAAAGAGAYLGLRPSGSTTESEVLPAVAGLPNANDYLADPQQPIYDPSTGFSADAVKVLTLTSLQFSLEQYQIAQGSYPASLGDLFPTYAPVDQNDQPLTAAPDGFAYTQASGGSSYDLSVTLSAGKPYTVHQPDPSVHQPAGTGE